MSISIRSAVGRGVYGAQRDDVELVQTCLSAIQVLVQGRYKTLYEGPKDGVQRPELGEAIAAFQSSERIAVTGKIEPGGPTISRLEQKVPSNIGQEPIIPPLYDGPEIGEARNELMDIARTAKRLAAAVREKQSTAKKMLYFDSDGDGRADTKLYKALKRFDRWFDVAEGKVRRKGTPTKGLPERLERIADRAEKLADLPSSGRWPIYDLQNAVEFTRPPNYVYDDIKPGNAAHRVTSLFKSVSYRNRWRKPIARLQGQWIAVLPDFKNSRRTIIPILVHEFVHALNLEEGRKLGKESIGGHIAKTDLDFNRSVDEKLNRENAWLNPSNWAAFIAGKEFEK